MTPLRSPFKSPLIIKSQTFGIFGDTNLIVFTFFILVVSLIIFAIIYMNKSDDDRH